MVSTDAQYLVNDLVQGDESILKRNDFLELNISKLQKAIQIITHNPYIPDDERKYLLANSWRVHYRKKPPTIEEFLTEDWIGPTANSLYPKVKETLINYWQPDSEYRNLILASSIGTGKSLTSAISSLYITIHLWSMRNPKKFFGLSQAASIVHAMISFTISKAQQLLLQPFYQILLSSPKFRRIRQEEKLIIKQEEEFPDKICWTSSGKIGVLQFYNDVHYMIASSPAQLLGLNMISAILSEISFFIEQGFSADYIWRIYNDSKGRIQSRFGTRYFATTILDSSPNDMEASPIDKYIFSGQAEKDKRNYIVRGAHWEHLPWKYPIWQKTKETFPVFKGSSSEPPKMLDKSYLQKYTKDDIYNVPIDIKQLFIDDLVKSVKDYCGWPSGTQSKLIRDYNVIEDCFDESLRNFYTYIYAPADQSPELLLWNQVVDKFFIHHGNGKYEFYRSPHEIRFMHIDQSESGDFTGISMVHPELTINGELIYITDFTIALNPGKHRVNLDAIRLFIIDLKVKGRIKFGLITFDQYQSSSTIQFLKNKGFKCERLSVDRDPNPYLVTISLLNNRRVKSGKNLLLKNNLKSLQEIKTPSGKKKIDHLKGKIDRNLATNDWVTSTIGFYAKDLSDAWVGAIWNAIHNYDLTPRYMYQIKKRNQTVEESRNEIKEQLLTNIKQKYGLIAAHN